MISKHKDLGICFHLILQATVKEFKEEIAPKVVENNLFIFYVKSSFSQRGNMLIYKNMMIFY